MKMIREEEPVIRIRVSASCRMVNSWGLPMLMGPSEFVPMLMVGLAPAVSALTLTDGIYLTPRQSTSISCTDCATHS